MANHIPTIDRLGLAVSRVAAAAGLARAVTDHVPNCASDFGKVDCLDAVELYLLRPAAAELQEVYEEALAEHLGHPNERHPPEAMVRRLPADSQ